MILPNRLLILSVFLCQSAVFFSSSLNAKEMLKESASSEAQSSVHAAVAYKQPNRVVVLNSKIVRAVYDNNLIQADKDPTTGSLYVVPLTKETTGMFVVTESGQTHSITLSPKERLTAQTVTLKESGTFSSFDGPSVPSELSGLPYEERIQTALKLIPAIAGLRGRSARRHACPAFYLHAQPVRAWNALGLRLERYRILNRTKHKQTVREPEFWRNGVLAVATEASDLAPGASADLWLVRSAR